VALTPIEIIVLVFALLGIAKIITLSVNAGKWFKFVERLYKNPKLTTTILFVLTIIVGYYIFIELTIIQVFASFALMSLLMGLGMLAYNKEIIETAKKLSKKKFKFSYYIYLLIWLVLCILALSAVFINS